MSKYQNDSKYRNKEETSFKYSRLTESIRQPKSAPLMLWLGGGPGCTATGSKHFLRLSR